MTTKVYIGIDPGKTGGIAFLGDEGRLMRASKMPETEADVLSLLTFPGDLRACLELLTPLPAKFFGGDGADSRENKIGRGSIANFRIGQNYGFYRGLLIALRIPFETVTPLTWQRYLHCLTHGNKNISKAKAQELYPGADARITHATADAILIGRYLYLWDTGKLPVPEKISRKKPDPRQERVPFPGQEGVDDF